MALGDISFFECDNESYLRIDKYLSNSRCNGYEYSYNYYEIDVNYILPYKKSDNEYVIRYIDVNKLVIAPLQIKIKNFLGNLHKLKNNITLVPIESDNKELFKKLRQIWKRIIKIIGINNAKDFVKNTIDGTDEFIIIDVHKKTSFVKGINSDTFVIVCILLLIMILKHHWYKQKQYFYVYLFLTNLKHKKKSIS